jgi:PAS domain S-box-containing protein
MRLEDKKVRALLDATTELAMLLDKEGNILALNKAAASRFGLGLTEIIGKNVFNFLPPEVATRRKAFAEKMIKSKKSMRVIDENQGTFFDNNFHPIFDDMDNVIQFAVYAKDITKDKLAEQELLSYKDKLRNLASKLLLAEEKERRRIAREVHDNIGQNLAFAKIKMSELQKTDMLPHFRDTVESVLQLIKSTIQDTRSLVSEIGSPILYELGFEPAVEGLVKKIKQKNFLNVSFENDRHQKPLHDDVKVFLFQAVRELLANVVKHSKAANCTVSLKVESGKIRVDVGDDGIGFETEIIGTPENANEGFGFFSIRERLEPLGGSIGIYSKPNEGTLITLFAPLQN